ncbi:hypothetical protein GCM10027290_03440 [Micromonospora sonneratiae]|uniref:Glycosyltransferase family 2 protein n=1 Tax=Micromonospora sonneratiae TaxID=1184706 RepID=A0ABW3Y786_9ACTN
MEHPLVSIIVPNYNYAHTLEACLTSLQRQTYQPTEIIMVDDGSTDDSVAIARRLGVRVEHTARNIGAPGARNHGAELAAGEILFFVDSDVEVRPDAVANAVELLLADARIGAVCGNYDPEPLIRDSLVEEYRALQQYYWLAADEGDITTTYTALFAIRTDVFLNEVGPFDPSLRHTENAEYGHRLSRTHRIVLTSSVRGRHDYDDRLAVVLSKLFHRARLHVPLYLRRPDFQGGPSQDTRAWGSLAALLTLPSVALPVLFGPLWAAVPLLLLVGFLAGEAGVFRFVAGQRGPAFLAYFVAMHFLATLTIALAGMAGVAQYAVSPVFRRTYVKGTA